ncbi:DUF6906 family protein [Paenibacillus antibioticophila]|uniref:DUF6906 family protein n=1 Tax=Paenibacillus TaxID=44249 RepID=UPI001BB3B5C5|nr:hypothetical protein [Paenibacillus antibioticophila]
MKNGKNPTRRQLKVLAKHVATPSDWLISKQEPDRWHLVHRFKGDYKLIFL